MHRAASPVSYNLMHRVARLELVVVDVVDAHRAVPAGRIAEPKCRRRRGRAPPVLEAVLFHKLAPELLVLGHV